MTMGRYYIAVSHARKEYVDPTEITMDSPSGSMTAGKTSIPSSRGAGERHVRF